MAMPGPAYDEARLRARYHVQVELAHAAVATTPAHVPVTGRVRRIFRRDDSLRLGDEVHFSVAVCRPGDRLAPGGDRWMDLWLFERATYMEAYLTGRAVLVPEGMAFLRPATQVNSVVQPWRGRW